MTDDEVFAEFYFTTIVVPAWKQRWKLLRDPSDLRNCMETYNKLPGSYPNRLKMFIVELYRRK